MGVRAFSGFYMGVTGDHSLIGRYVVGKNVVVAFWTGFLFGCVEVAVWWESRDGGARRV
jgi:hypothetical protein